MKRLIIFLLLSASVLIAQPKKFDDENMPPGKHREAFIEKLNLTSDQQKQFDKLHSDMQKSQIAQRAKVQTLRLELKDLFNEDNPSRTKIEAKLGEITKLQGDMKTSHVGFWFDVNKILTADQQKIWKEHRMMLGDGVGQKGMRGDRGCFMKPMGRHGRGIKQGDCQNCPCN
jgi:Spy/CpxP family protein refolding chaperone